MKLLSSPREYTGGPCALAMGKFDGVHRGHQAVLSKAVSMAAARGIESVALTFDRNPLALLDPAHAPEVITPLARKRALIEQVGIGWLIVCPFTPELAAMEPEAFLRELMGALRPAAIVCGENFTFGHFARGNARMLAAMADELGYEAAIVPLCRIDGEHASSTRIRALIGEGDLAAAERMLGRGYRDTTDGEE